MEKVALEDTILYVCGMLRGHNGTIDEAQIICYVEEAIFPVADKIIKERNKQNNDEDH